MKYNSIFCFCIALLFPIASNAQHINLGIYGGANIMNISGPVKDFYNKTTASTTPTIGATIKLDFKKFQAGFGICNTKIQINQAATYYDEMPFYYGYYDGFKALLTFTTFQFIANYKFQKSPSYLYAGLNANYLIAQKNENIATAPNSQYIRRYIPLASGKTSDVVYGIQVGYNLHLVKGLNIQIESGIKAFSWRIQTFEQSYTYPYYPNPVSARYEKVNFLQVPILFGISYNL